MCQKVKLDLKYLMTFIGAKNYVSWRRCISNNHGCCWMLAVSKIRLVVNLHHKTNELLGIENIDFVDNKFTCTEDVYIWRLVVVVAQDWVFWVNHLEVWINRYAVSESPPNMEKPNVGCVYSKVDIYFIEIAALHLDLFSFFKLLEHIERCRVDMPSLLISIHIS